MLDGHQAVPEHPAVETHDDTATVELPGSESLEEPEYRRSSGSTNGEQPATRPSSPPPAEPE